MPEASTLGRVMFGRRQIFTDAGKITEANVVEVLRAALSTHEFNRSEIDYLYRYYKGEQPILKRKKDVRPEINNKIVVNRANEIVSFKTGYLVGDPIQYVNRKGQEDISDAISRLNDFMSTENKAAKDKELADWFHICGTAFRLVLPKPNRKGWEAPFDIYTLNPLNTFVVYYNDYSKRALMGVTYSVNDITSECTYDIYTSDKHFRVVDDKLVSSTPHIIGGIPIIEYPSNHARLGAFEIVLPLLDSINNMESNRDDAVEQFVQALMVFSGANITREQINELKDLGALKLPENADVKYLVQELSQQQTQIKVDNDYQTVLTITGLPNRNGGSSTSDTGSAVIMRDGWESAEARAKDSETIFKCSEMQTLELVGNICRSYGVMDIKPYDVEVRFTRRNYDNIQSKAQVLVTMLSNEKIEPRLAFQHCGLFADPELAYRISMQYYEANKPEELAAEVIEETDADT